MMNSFWWGSSTDGQRGIRWVEWDKLCAPKKYGVLGFRNLRCFDLAMLGNCFCVTSTPLLSMEEMTVQDLFIVDGMAWDKDLWKGLFTLSDVSRITSVLVAFYKKTDKLMWHYDRNGQYTVQPGYCSAMAMMVLAITCERFPLANDMEHIPLGRGRQQYRGLMLL
ncbi:hypothetical protein GOBAR_AA09086 [Gossypium barbadense]|uniref:Reverse transcriptase zinc-binding domain-containing protein n=1 Tax=Gossypium barbadense TaxID=3634 RepID=A0A2P5Y7K1_GOSBA|nr:hypothetical protein GOBAR_AA09086 [Gossypium barbadense]